MDAARLVRLVRTREVVHPAGEIRAGEVAALDARAILGVHAIDVAVHLVVRRRADIRLRAELDQPVQREVPGARTGEEALFLQPLDQRVLAFDARFAEAYQIGGRRAL